MSKIKEGVQEAADYINNLNPFIGLGIVHLPVLEDCLKNTRERLSTIQSAAPIIGPGYEQKELDLKYRIQRMEALVNLLKAYKESEATIREIADLNQHRENISEMFGL